MPIVSRSLRKYNVQKDGRARVMELHTDALGNVVPIQYMTVKSQADATLDMNARDLTETLRERDVDEVLRWVESGNDPNTFDYTNREIGRAVAENRVVLTFARSRGEASFPYAWWIDGLGPARWNTITGRLGWDATRADRVKARAATIQAAIPSIDQTEDV